MRYKILMAAIFASLGVSAPFTQVAAADAAAGKTKTVTCAACHGAQGVATLPGYPHLACQNEKYLVVALQAYKSGARKNPLMAPMVAILSETDIENVAAYYASLPCKN